MENITSIYDEKLLIEDFHPNIEAYYFKEWNNYSMGDIGHMHNRTEIMYILNGTCYIITENKRYKLNKNDFIFIDSKKRHSLIVEKDARCRILNIEFDFTKNKIGNNPIKNILNTSLDIKDFLFDKKEYIILKDQGEVFEALKNIIYEKDNTKACEYSIIIMNFYLLIMYMARLYKIQYIKKSNNEYIDIALRTIISKYDTNLSIKVLAEEVSLSPIYFQRLFKNQTGKTVTSFINEIRINKAKMLLDKTNMPIIEISETIGYNNRQYFTKVFKKETAITPKEYRKKS